MIPDERYIPAFDSPANIVIKVEVSKKSVLFVTLDKF